jgi:hypothetical protein
MKMDIYDSTTNASLAPQQQQQQHQRRQRTEGGSEGWKNFSLASHHINFILKINDGE